MAAETNEVTRSGTLGVCDGPGITRDPQLRARVPGLVIFVGLEQPAAGTEHSGQTNSNVDLNILT